MDTKMPVVELFVPFECYRTWLDKNPRNIPLVEKHSARSPRMSRLIWRYLQKKDTEYNVVPGWELAVLRGR